MRKIDPCRAEPASQILQIPAIADLHESQNIGTNLRDHPDDGLFFRFRLARAGPEVTAYAPRHREVVLHIVGGDPDLPLLRRGGLKEPHPCGEEKKNQGEVK